MRGGYVGLMNCVFAAQKAVSPASPGKRRFELIWKCLAESPHRRADSATTEYRYFTTDLPSADGTPHRGDLLAMERSRGIVAIPSRRSKPGP